MSNREKILSKIKSVKALPPAVGRVASLLQKKETNISELTKAIEYDPGLTSNVLRFANSAGLGGLRAIKTLKDAIVRLGMNRIFQLIMVSAVSPIVQVPVKGYDLPSGKLWEHSISVAVGVGELSKYIRIQAPDYIFTAGLLHDIGKVVLGTFVEVDAHPIMELAFMQKISFDKAEEQVLGINHSEVGAALLEDWNLPEDIIRTIRWHHEPEKCSDSTLGVDLIHVLDAISMSFGLGAGIDGLNYAISPEVMKRLDLKSKDIEYISLKTMDLLEQVKGLFSNDR
jgi:putative nucleotidyltransferase with HDIG domain